MAARLRKHHQDEVRAKIQASVLIDLLMKCATGEHEISRERMKAIEILLKKSVPDLQSIELTGEDGGPVEHSLTVAFVKPGDSVPREA